MDSRRSRRSKCHFIGSRCIQLRNSARGDHGLLFNEPHPKLVAPRKAWFPTTSPPVFNDFARPVILLRVRPDYWGRSVEDLIATPWELKHVRTQEPAQDGCRLRSLSTKRQALKRLQTAALEAEQVRQLHRAGVSKAEFAHRLQMGRISVHRMNSSSSSPLIVAHSARLGPLPSASLAEIRSRHQVRQPRSAHQSTGRTRVHRGPR